MELHKNDVDLSEYFMARYGYVVACARRYVITPEQVEDVVQQTFVKFISNRERWNPEVDLAPLLYQITKNTALTYNQEIYRHSSKRMFEITELIAVKRLVDDKTEWSGVNLEEELLALDECLYQLPPKKKELIDMHYQQNRSIRSISLLLGAKENTITKVICRIRDALGKCIMARMKKIKNQDGP